MLPAHLKTVGKFIWLAARNHWVEHAFCHLLDKTSKTRSGTWLNGISLAGPSCVNGMKDSICSHVIESKYCRKMKWVCNWLVHLFFHTCNSYPCCLNKTAPSALLNCRLWAPNANEKGFLPFAKRCVDDTTRTQRWIYGCSQFDPAMKTTKWTWLFEALWSIQHFPLRWNAWVSADCSSMYVAMTTRAHSDPKRYKS